MNLPPCWKSALLGDHLDILTGCPFESEHYTNDSDSIRLLRGDNIVQGSVRWEDARMWPSSKREVLDRFRLEEGDLVLAMDRSWVKAGLKFAVIKKNDIPCLLVQRVARLRGRGGLCTPFVTCLIGSHKFSQYVKGVQTETAVPHISTQQIREFPIALPPLPEQHKIAAILSTWDEASEKLNALIAAKDRRKYALMQQLLTSKKRVKRSSAKWFITNLGNLFTERVERNRCDLPLLSITADRGVVRRDDLTKRDTSSEDKSKYLMIAPGDIGYNTMRMWQGVSALSSLEGIVSPAYTILIPGERIDGCFAAHFFKLPHTINLFYRHSQGLVDDTLNLKFHNFAVIKINVPSDIKEQRQIADILDSCDDELRLLRSQRVALDRQKRGLMQRLLTGTVSVHPEKESQHA